MQIHTYVDGLVAMAQTLRGLSVKVQHLAQQQLFPIRITIGTDSIQEQFHSAPMV